MWLFALPIALIAAAFIPRRNARGETVSLWDTFGPFEFYGPFMNDNIAEHGLAIAKEYLEANEGRRKDVYKDHLGILTVGIGHKVLPMDSLVFGQVISNQRIDDFFSKDVAAAFAAAKKQAKELNKYNSNFIAALIEVNFQLGTGWKNTFSNTYNDLKSGNAQAAIDKLKKSLWNKQTPDRVANFIEAIQTAYA